MGFSGGDVKISLRFCACTSSRGTRLLITGDVDVPEKSWFKSQVKAALYSWMETIADSIRDHLSNKTMGVARVKGSTIRHSFDWVTYVREWGPVTKDVREYFNTCVIVFLVLFAFLIIFRVFNIHRLLVDESALNFVYSKNISAKMDNYIKRLEASELHLSGVVSAEMNRFFKEINA